MTRFRFSLANLIWSVLFIGAVCAAIINARRASKLQAERNAVETVKEQELQALMATAIEREAIAYSNFSAFQDFRMRVANLLTDAMNDDDPAVRQWAARMLGPIGPSVPEALTALERLTEDIDPAVRTAAAAALDRIKNKTDAPASQVNTACRE